MTERHLSPATLQAYVMGDGDGDAAAVEAHVAGCSACAAALTREARLEEALHQLGDELAHPLVAPAITPLPDDRRPARARPGRRPGLLAALAAAPAAAAAAWLLLASGKKAPSPTGPTPTVTALPASGATVLRRCPSGAAMAACVGAAQRLGLAVISESQAVLVPRYERSQPPLGLHADLVIP